MEISLMVPRGKNAHLISWPSFSQHRAKFEKLRSFERAFKGAIPQDLKETIKKELI